MTGIVIIVIIAAVLLILLGVYDKRKSIINFFKEKVFKPKKIKIPKTKEKQKIDPDTMVNEDNIDYGKVESYDDAIKQPEQTKIDDNAEFENIFNQNEDDDEEDIDLDKIFEELRIEQAKKGGKKFKSELLDETEPNFDFMSMEDLDSLLEDKLSKGNVPDDLESISPLLNSKLTGEELGKVIKNLPPQLKILIVSDILKRKF